MFKVFIKKLKDIVKKNRNKIVVNTMYSNW